jgi:uncharacterized protein
VAKLILIIAVALIVYSVVRSFLRKRERADQAPKPRVSEDMVRCAHCGVNLPLSESLLSKGKYFCSNEHRLLHNK